jgi:2-polyprenyl-3-methyl-5-hydroxy-6-metoxy-1,4-benzoquinol methylase
MNDDARSRVAMPPVLRRNASEPELIARIAARYRLRQHRSYVRGKLRWDPVYDAVRPLLAASSRPLLDVGCGLGILGQFLREHGFGARYVGIDLDARKIGEAQNAAREGLDLEFAMGSATAPPELSGDVALLDVLHYLPAGHQQLALAQAAARVPPGGILVIRNVVRDGSWRFRATVAEEHFSRVLRWMRYPATHYPERDEIEAPLRATGFSTEVMPLWGRTPFNSYLFVARRDDRE